VLHKLRDPTFDLDPVSTVKQVDRIDGCQLIGHIQFMAELPIAGPNPHKEGACADGFPSWNVPMIVPEWSVSTVSLAIAIFPFPF